LNFNGKEHLVKCIDSVIENNYRNFEIILFDNNSTDSSLEIAEARFGHDHHLKIIRSKKNLGFAGGNNFAFQHTKGEFIVFLNNDTVVDCNWLTTLVNVLKKDPTIGLAQSLILNMHNDMIQNAGWIFDRFLVNKHPLCNGESKDLQLEPVFEISFACGASMIVRREIVQRSGLFDDSMPFFYDDTLLSLKTWLANKRVVTVSDSKVRHISGATKVWKVRFTTYHLAKSNVCLLFDIYPKLSNLACALWIKSSNIATNSIFCIKNKNIAAVVGHLQTFIWAIGNFRCIWRNKLNHWSKCKVSPQTLAENFLRIKLPVPFYLFPSKLAFNCNAFEVRKYERQVMKSNQTYF